MSRKKNPHPPTAESTSVLDAPGWVWLFVVGAVLYAVWYLSAPMPWPAPGPGEVAYEPTRGQLVTDGLLLLPEHLANWFGGGTLPLGLFDKLGILLLAGVLLVISYVLGEFLLFRLHLLERLYPVEGVVLRLATGLAALSWWVCIIGQLGLLQHTFIAVLSLAIVLLVAGNSWKNNLFLPHKFIELERDDAEMAAPRRDTETIWWLLAAAPLILFVVGTAWLPPYEYDVLEYHLQVPKEWYRDGQIRTLPHNVYSGMPMAAEVWTIVPMIFLPWFSDWYYGALAGKLVMGLFTLGNAALLFAAGKRLAGIWAARTAALAALAVPWLIYESGTGLVDGVWAYYTLAALYPVLLLLKQPVETEHPLPVTGLAILSGLMAGMAFSVKYPALLMAVLPVLGLWVYVRRWDWKTLGLYTAAVTVVVAPWLVKNLVSTGNPVYPLAGNVFPADIRSEAQIAQWNAAHAVPRNAAGHSYSLDQAVQGAAIFLGKSPWAGLAIVPLTVVGLFHPRRKVVLALVAMLAVAWVVWWGFSHRLERFLIPAIPLGCLLAGLGADRLSQFPAGRYAVRAWLTGSLIVTFVLVNVTPSIKLDPRIFVAQDDLAQSHTAGAVAFLNEHAAREDVVLATGDAALFYLLPHALYHTCFDHAPLAPLIEMDAQQRQVWLAERNIRWVYVHWGEIARFRSPGNYGFPEYVTREWFAELEDQGLLVPTPYQLGNPEKPTVVVYRVSAGVTP